MSFLHPKPMLIHGLVMPFAPMCESVCVYIVLYDKLVSHQGVFLLHHGASSNRLQIRHDPDQNEVVTENE